MHARTIESGYTASVKFLNFFHFLRRPSLEPADQYIPFWSCKEAHFFPWFLSLIVAIDVSLWTTQEVSSVLRVNNTLGHPKILLISPCLLLLLTPCMLFFRREQQVRSLWSQKSPRYLSRERDRKRLQVGRKTVEWRAVDVPLLTTHRTPEAGLPLLLYIWSIFGQDVAQWWSVHVF